MCHYRNFVLAASLLLAACATSNEPQKPVIKYDLGASYDRKFTDMLTKYKRLKTYKAIALAISEDGTWAYGYAYDYPTQEAADRQAMAECSKPQGGKPASAWCQLVAEGDIILIQTR